MAPAPKLPPEVLDIIFSYVDEDENSPIWYHLSLVNHSWHAVATPRLYRSFQYHGDYEKRGMLWMFLRTISEDPWLASLARTVDLQHALKYTGGRSIPRAELLCKQCDSIIRQAITQAHLSSLGTDTVLEALRKDDRRPLVAMILASLPNIETIYLNVSDSDPFLEPLLRRAVGFQHADNCESTPQTPIFKRLHRLFIAPEDHEHTREPLNISMLQPFVYIPNLRTLSTIATSIDPNLYTWREKPAISPSLSELTIVLHETVQLREFFLLLESMPCLTRLSLCFNGIPATSWEPWGRKALWDQLERFQHTLQHLDLSGIIVERNRPQPGTSEYCVPLQRFTRLETLSIEPNVLIGNCVQCDPPTQLSHHLPRRLKQLTLYDGNMLRLHQGQQFIPQLERQLADIARMSDPPGQITLEKRWNADSPKQLAIACQERSIPFHCTAPEQLEHGGRLSSFARSSQRHIRPNQPQMVGVLRQLVRSRSATGREAV